MTRKRRKKRKKPTPVTEVKLLNVAKDMTETARHFGFSGGKVGDVMMMSLDSKTIIDIVSESELERKYGIVRSKEEIKCKTTYSSSAAHSAKSDHRD